MLGLAKSNNGHCWCWAIILHVLVRYFLNLIKSFTSIKLDYILIEKLTEFITKFLCPALQLRGDSRALLNPGVSPGTAGQLPTVILLFVHKDFQIRY